MHFLNPQKNTFLYNFFGASTHGQSKNCSLLFCTDLSAKNGVRMIAYHNKKFIIEIWGRFWKPQIPIAYRTKSTVMPWPKAPLPYSCAHEQGRGHRRFCAISPVPDAFVKFSQWRRRRGRCCGASVGTTGSAPSARSRPRSVVRGLCWNKLFRPLSTKRRAISSESDQTTKIEFRDFASVLSIFGGRFFTTFYVLHLFL